ncbi:YfhJ family protein [Ectobacillus ponti]|uniref:YfhJ family protein n=1 Tax=Ectobacillus ponti TaxID=2961894 RepID=A0AA41X8Y5_9BACI|nr:YfhJ family protein [Ectobacillus ponti]MCP8970982.1 YfhJ family protein [Ectobacillus ponti]
MNDLFEKLTNELLQKNEHLSYAQARAWVELLWSDFEASYARVGKYHGNEMTEQIVSKWIAQHGERLHLVQTQNPKYKHLINQEDHLKH